MNPTREQILDLLPEYVAGVLEPDAMLTVDAYLDEQQELLRQVRVAEDALALMAASGCTRGAAACRHQTAFAGAH